MSYDGCIAYNNNINIEWSVYVHAGGYERWGKMKCFNERQIRINSFQEPCL